MSIGKFINVDVKKMKEKRKKRELEELEKLKPIPEAVKEEIKLKKAIEKRRKKYKKRKNVIKEVSDIEEDLMKQYELQTGRNAITTNKTVRKDYLKWKNEQ